MAPNPLCFQLAFAMTCFYLLLGVAASQGVGPARALDSLLQDHAYKAFARPRTGVPYDGVVPSNLTGIKIAAMRLRSGSLKNRGVKKYKEFEIPTGVMVFPRVQRLVLVYQNLGNWSLSYYPLPGYTFLAPVLGLLAYSAQNLSATGLPELHIEASGKPMSITFQNVPPPSNGGSASMPKCVWFNLSGAPSFTNLLSGDTCSTTQQGHFSVVVFAEAATPSSSPAPLPHHLPRPPPSSNGPAGKDKSRKKWIIIGSVLAALLAVALLSVVAWWARGLKKRKKIQQMQRAADVGEALQMTSVGYTKVPAAAITRTQPAIENEYVP